TNISEIITSDHRDLEDAYNHIMNAPDAEERAKWQNQFTWELARHSLGEELVVYPSMEKHLNNGTDMADHDRMEHQVVKELLYKFQGLQPNDPEFMPVLKNLWENLAQHIKEEEGKDLPQLEESLDDAESRQMAASFHRTKQFVPTRSHPNAPNKPPFETVAGLMTAPMDKIRDMFRSFP
ncbi:HHE domain protein, partial [Aspergillus homomorphus CBS 101889]